MSSAAADFVFVAGMGGFSLAATFFLSRIGHSGVAIALMVLGSLMVLGQAEFMGGGVATLGMAAFVLAGYYGRTLGIQQVEGARRERIRPQRDAIRQERGVSLGEVWYTGGIPSLRPQGVEVFVGASHIWLAPSMTKDTAIQMRRADIASITVSAGSRVEGGVSLTGAVLGGAAMARTAQTVDDGRVLIAWRPNASAPAYEVELRAPLGDMATTRQLHGKLIEGGISVPNGGTAPRPSSSAAQTGAAIPCPWCAEEIRADAVICRHCNRDVASGARR